MQTALIVGSTGIVGQNLAQRLLRNGWNVLGLSRGKQVVDGVQGLSADLRDAAAVREVLRGQDVSHVFLSAWIRHETEAENVKVNGGIVENVFDGLEGAKNLKHAALVTGTKQYLGPFESYGQTAAETPFREDTPRLPGLNFYYTQEDVLYAAAERMGFGWSVHRPHTIVGYAVGNAMNMGSTLAVYATLCRESGESFIFPGSHEQWNALTDVTDARLLAEHLEWASTRSAGRDEAFNVVNGDVFRWRWLWPQLAAYFGVKPEGPPAEIAPLEGRMGEAPEDWKAIASKYDLAESDVTRVASWWHTDGDLGRKIECVNDMSKSRRVGFVSHQDTPASFFDLFDRLKADQIIPG
ncbi:SDR family oxidoreductase [Granulicella tundricola]|uniref:NAD-dependent epimerase/dehydratase n=1 Tax=Granulicella tundricola (strain ATCC BAA-1859 / DSM 23138 / MP5ACTX9) TaxID=1198114 RepID=E8X3W7_GRATM|nr:SDR family oxidoreductase [Granulicella tundricola]ADW70475.1 NAD-dependent epimerase/dehydratase [Granulicella tundricola MP5ACTX9]